MALNIKETDLWQYLKTAEKPIVLYGMGNGADKILSVLEGYEINISGIFATDGFVRDKYFGGFKLSSYSALKEKLGDMIVLLCFGTSLPEVISNINRIAAEQELYAPDVPVYGDGLFTREFFETHKADFEFVYSRLADDISKKTLENIINYKLSGKLFYLYNSETSEDEPYQSFLKLSDNESFLDLGAYRGDTAKGFINRVKSYKSITALEPDLKTFKKLTENTEKYKNIKCINACVSDSCGVTEFSMRGGRNSSLGKGTEIQMLNIDTACPDASFIKMDIEGEELKAILGAENTIIKNKPKMQIACYHRNEDIFSLPKAVFDIRDDYKLYLRHTPCLPAWDLNYYFV